MMTTHAQRRALGDFGERLAVRYLEQHGLVVLERNWRCARGELDIVAADAGVLVGCEVKTRSSDRFGTPLEAITPDKYARLHRLVQTWANEHARDHDRFRVDVVSVVRQRRGPATVEHLVGVV